MNPIHAMAALLFGGIFLAGCNPGSDQVDPVTEQDQPAAPAAPAEMPPATGDTGVPAADETMLPPTDAAPGTAAPPPDVNNPTEPTQDPPPPDR